MHNYQLAEQFLNTHDTDGWFRDPNYEGPCEAIDPAKIDQLTDAIQDFIANVIASILDAGSERDAVNEAEELRTAIANELRSWVWTEESPESAFEPH